MTDSQGTGSLFAAPVVVFEETGEERRIAAFCRRCYRHIPDPYKVEFGVVSPGGMAHIGAEYGATGCGIDATADGWWHRL